MTSRDFYTPVHQSTVVKMLTKDQHATGGSTMGQIPIPIIVK